MMPPTFKPTTKNHLLMAAQYAEYVRMYAADEDVIYESPAYWAKIEDALLMLTHSITQAKRLATPTQPSLLADEDGGPLFSMPVA